MGKLINRSLPVICVLLTILVLLSGGCKKNNSDDGANTGATTTATSTTSANANKPGGPITFIEKPLTMTAGQLSEIQLEATGGKPPYSWRVKAGFFLPGGFSLNSKGVITGTPSELTGGATEEALPAFTVIIRDSEGEQVEAEVTITFLQP